MKKFPKRYNAKKIENKIVQIYKNNRDIFYWKDDSSISHSKNNDLNRENNFSIDTPPPTISGSLHMGHIFSYSQSDFIARYKRLNDYNVFYPIGFDNNGLPTERLVEKIYKIKAKNCDKEIFKQKCQSVIKESIDKFTDLFDMIGFSFDWNQKYDTISDNSAKLSQLSFIDLYNKGFIERRKEPILFDVIDNTALAQADLIDKEFVSYMNYFNFYLLDNNENIIQNIEIATTRPELLPALRAVMVNKDDKRYNKFIDSYIIDPVFGIKVKIIADDLVNIDKGSGAVMCCSFGDETDILWYKRYDLGFINIINDNGYLKEINIDEIESKINIKNKNKQKDFLHKYNSLFANKKVIEARRNIVNYLEEQNLMNKREKITHNVKCGERSKSPVEILVKNQWFIKVANIKSQLVEKVNQINWYPKYMKERILIWIDSLSWDWCISRKRYFGVKFPLWYNKKDQKIILADVSQLPCDPENTLPKNVDSKDLIAETDVMDTWATSSITPQLSSLVYDKIALDEISKDSQEDKSIYNEKHKIIYPFDLRTQAHEIIRSWAFYTIVKSYMHEDNIPWQNIMISGWCLADDGSKMSKSKGNIIVPDRLIEEKSADAIRYWASYANLGTDTIYSDNIISVGQKLINKLFNSSKFLQQFLDINILSREYNFNFANLDLSLDIKNKNIFCDLDLWLIRKLEILIYNYKKAFDDFKYHKAREYLDDFFLKIFCDNYLELVKVRSYGVNAFKYKNKILNNEERDIINQERKSAIYSLIYVMNIILKLYNPIMPFITEYLYQMIFNNIDIDNEDIDLLSKNDILTNNLLAKRGNFDIVKTTYFNQKDKDKYFTDLEKNIFAIISYVRKYKSANNLSLKSEIYLLEINSNFIFKNSVINDIKDMLSIKNIDIKYSNLNKDNLINAENNILLKIKK